jgi:radical SAM protein with 4Fe4S-binding SPASM domain
VDVGIEVTRRCNFRCGHCYVDAGLPRDRELTTREWTRVLRQLSRIGVTGVGWSGGEPLLYKELEDLTAAATARGLTTSLATNGYLATAERLRRLAKRGLSVLQVSLDGPDRERAARFRLGPANSFDRAVTAIRAGVDAGLATYVCALLTPETAGEVDEMATLASSLGAAGLRYTVWTPVGRARGQAYRERTWRSKAVRHFLEVTAEPRTVDGLILLVDCPTGPVPFEPDFKCGAGRDVAYVTAAGDVYPCTALMFPKYRIGNVRQTPIAELFDSPAMRRVTRQRARLDLGGGCTDCALADRCRGGCPGRTIAAFGELAAKPHAGAMPVCLVRLHGRFTLRERRQRHD